MVWVVAPSTPKELDADARDTMRKTGPSLVEAEIVDVLICAQEPSNSGPVQASAPQTDGD